MTHIVGGFGEIGVKWWVCALCAAVLLMRYIIVIRKLLNVNCKVAFESGGEEEVVSGHRVSSAFSHTGRSHKN